MAPFLKSIFEILVLAVGSFGGRVEGINPKTVLVIVVLVLTPIILGVIIWLVVQAF